MNLNKMDLNKIIMKNKNLKQYNFDLVKLNKNQFDRLSDKNKSRYDITDRLDRAKDDNDLRTIKDLKDQYTKKFGV